MKKLALFSLLLSTACIIWVGFLYFSGGRPHRIGYINTTEVYDSFPLKKELADKVTHLKKVRAQILDSLKTGIIQTDHALDVNDKKGQDALLLKKQAYLQKEKQFTTEDESLIADYDKQLWTQLNQYIRDFGREKGYSIIMGATGNGNLMYADEALDITKEMQAYVNSRYKGGPVK